MLVYNIYKHKYVPYEDYPEGEPPRVRVPDPKLNRRTKRLLKKSYSPPDYDLTHTWDSKDCSPEVYVDEVDSRLCKYVSNSNTTGCVRGTVGYSEGVHCWEIHWPAKVREQHCVVGVASVHAPLQCNGKLSLVGKTADSWGWDIMKLHALHDIDNKPCKPYPDFVGMETHMRYIVPDTFYMILNMNARTLTFALANYTFGVACSKLRGQTLYPIVNLTTSNAVVRIRYLKRRSTKLSNLSLPIAGDVHETVPVNEVVEDVSNKLTNCLVNPDSSNNKNDGELPEFRQETNYCPKIEMLTDPPSLPPEWFDEYHSWNGEDCPYYVYVDDFNHNVCCLTSGLNCTGCVRTKHPYSMGIHCFEFNWPVRWRDYHCVVGVATQNAPVQYNGRISLVGKDKHSWGWDISQLQALHDYDNVPSRAYPDFRDGNVKYTVPDTFCMILNMEEGTLSFAINGRNLGVAFRNLQGKMLYPIVNLTTSQAPVHIKYIGRPSPGVPRLLDLCRSKFRRLYSTSKLGNYLREELVMRPLREYVENPPKRQYYSHIF